MNFVKNLTSFFFGDPQSAKPEPTPASASTSSNGSFKRTVRQSPGVASQRSQGKQQKRPEPLLQDAGPSANGGVQSLRWYTRKMRQDEDGSVADAFFVESNSGPRGLMPKQVRTAPRPAPVEVLMVDGGNIILSH